MLLISTVGFDEKFILRFLMRHGVREKDKILLIVKKDFMKNEKAKTAFNNIKNVVENLISRENLDYLEIDIKDNPMKNIRMIANKIENYREKEIKVCLSGGMRILIILTLLALEILPRKNITIDVDFENMEGYQTIDYTVIKIPRNHRWISLLKYIEENIKTVTELAEKMNLSPATISRELNEMEKYNLIKRHTNRIEITELGKSYKNLNQS